MALPPPPGAGTGETGQAQGLPHSQPYHLGQKINLENKISSWSISGVERITSSIIPSIHLSFHPFIFSMHKVFLSPLDSEPFTSTVCFGFDLSPHVVVTPDTLSYS